MIGTITVSSGDVALNLTPPPHNFVLTPVEDHPSFRDLFEPSLLLPDIEDEEDMRDLESTRRLYEVAGIEAFIEYSGRRQAGR